MKTKLLFSFLFLCSSLVFSQTGRRDLVVSMYPFIPNADNFYRKLETRFEQLNPDINLIVRLNPDYYNTDTTGIIGDKADVLEIDCILLDDFISKNRLQKIPQDINIKEKQPLAVTDVVYHDNTLYAVPHWVCGNFLFFKASDTSLKDIKKISEFQSRVGDNPYLNDGLLIDLNGKLTLGEMYLDALLDEYKRIPLILPYISLKTIDSVTVSNITKLPDLTYSNWGRDNIYHYKTGYYQSQFAKGNGRAFVGYSESLYYILREINTACSPIDKCIKEQEVIISEWCLSENGSTPIGWVDALGINSNLSGYKLEDAKKFIIFCVGQQSYYDALIPDDGDFPRYLLPAYEQYYSDAQILAKANLYTQFLPIVKRMQTLTGNNLMKDLRKIGEELDTKILKQ